MELIDNSPLGKVINKVFKENRNRYTNEVKLELLLTLPTGTITLDYFSSLEKLDDFNGSIGEYLVAGFSIPLGDYLIDILPNKENLYFTLKKSYLGKVKVRKFKGLLLNLSNSPMSGDISRMDRRELNTKGMEFVEVQLIRESVFALLNTYANGVYRDTTVKDLIKYCFSTVRDKIKIDNKELKLKIDVEEPDNKRVYRHINLNSNVNNDQQELKIMNLPSILQNGEYGVYNGNIGTYIKGRRVEKKADLTKEEYVDTVFVYPLYKPAKKGSRELFIYSCPSEFLSLSEKNYRDTGEIVEILVPDNIKNLDNTYDTEINMGKTYQVIDNNKIMNRPFETSDKQLNSKPSDFLSTKSNGERKDKIGTVEKRAGTGNQYKLRSEFIGAGVKILNFQWNFSVEELLTPDMRVTLLSTDENNKVTKKVGRLQSMYTRYDVPKKMSISMINVSIGEGHE